MTHLLPKPKLSDHLKGNLLVPASPSKSNGKVFVQGSFAHNSTENIFFQRGYTIVPFLREADIIVFTGGADVEPSLYGERTLPVTSPFPPRDKEDLEAIKLSTDVFKIGICRGAQLLNVIPNGGTLWQDVDHHNSCVHEVEDYITGHKHRVNSLHHQGIRLTPKAELLAFCYHSVNKVAEKEAYHRGVSTFEDLDVEAAYYPETRCLLFQPHPEFNHTETTDYFFDLIDRTYHAG